MSIRGQIAAHVTAKRLYQILPVIPGDPIERTLLVTKEINTLIDGPWPNISLERRANRLRADLETFVMGRRVAVSMTPFKHKSAYMGLLDKPEHGIWDIRSRDPNPGLRVLGGFIGTDIFVGILWRPRSVDWYGRQPLAEGKWLGWEIAKLECEKRWDQLFPNRKPMHGGNLRDHISENTFLV